MGIENGFMVTHSDIISLFLLGLLGVLVLVIFNFIAFRLWRSYRIKRDKNKHEPNWYDLTYFKEKFVGTDIGLTIIAIVCFAIMVGGLLVCGIQAYQNTKVEHIYFENYETEYNTLVNIADTTEDLVNTGIYLRINEYNKEISRLQAQYNDKNFSMNFSGDCDWNEMPLINLGGKS